MPIDKPNVTCYLHEIEDARLKEMASKHKIMKAQLARACMRIGMEIFEQCPEKVLPLAGLYVVKA